MVGEHHQSLSVEELTVKRIRSNGGLTIVIPDSATLAVNDAKGFGRFKIVMGAKGRKAKLFLNGKQVMK